VRLQDEHEEKTVAQQQQDFDITVKGAAGYELLIRNYEHRGAIIELDPDVVWTPSDLRKMAVSFEAAARMLTA
jgi:hypothetical protein